MKSFEELRKIRQKIDEVDKQIVKLIAERVSLIPIVAEFKKKENVVVHNPQREKQLIDETRKLAKELGVNPNLVEDIFNRLIKESHIIENKMIGVKK